LSDIHRRKTDDETIRNNINIIINNKKQ
jgi:hypothetical protein